MKKLRIPSLIISLVLKAGILIAVYTYILNFFT